MKKVALLAALLVLFTVGAFAQEGVDDGSVVYRTIQLYKVYDHPDAYVAMYHTTGIDLGQVTLPTDWFKIGSDKGIFRALPGDFSPYMLLQYTDGVFTKVVLTMPENRSNVAWGRMASTVDTEAGSQADTLILE